MFYKIIKLDESCSVEFYEPKVYESGFTFKKIITPFLELRLLKKLRNNDISFWNSVDAYHCLLVVFCAKLLFPKKKIFIIHHHYKFEMMEGLQKTIFRFFELNFLKMASSIIIPSPYILNETKRYLPSSKISYLEIAFEDHSNTKDNLVKKGQLLFVGNIEDRKGLHLLIDALHELKLETNDFLVNVAGAVIDLKYYEYLLRKIKEYGLEGNIVFHGRVTNEEKLGYLKTADAFVFPSLHEGYGMVIIEAMCFGVPVIAFNNSAIPYTVKDGYNGLLAANKDTHDLKQKLSDLLNNSTLRDRLSKGAFETFSKSRRLPLLIEEMKTFIKDLTLNYKSK